MCDDYRVNDLQHSLESYMSKAANLEAQLTLARRRCEMLERLYKDMIAQRNDSQEVQAKLHRHIDRLHEERDKWKRIATSLVHGAECQMDDLGGVKTNEANPVWLSAWYEYDREATRE